MTRPRLVFLTILLLLALFGVAKREVFVSEEEKIRIKTLSILEKCKDPTGTLNSLNSACMAEKFESFVTKENIGIIMEVLEGIFLEEDNKLELGSPTCHAPGHVIGEIGRNKGMSLADFWEICSTKCGYGCLHGGLIGSFEEEEGGFLSAYTKACDNIISIQSDEQLRSCWHVVGHGMGELFGEDIEGAVDKCLALPTEKERRHCVDGVRMEYLTGVSYNPLRADVSPEAIISFCQRFPAGYQNDCYGETSYYTFRLSGKEKDTIDVCREVPTGAETKEVCAFGGGVAFVALYKNSPEKLYEVCQKYGEPLVKHCLLGAVHTITGHYPLGDIMEVCEAYGGDFLGECLSFFGERLEFIAGRVNREEACGELDEDKRTNCLSEPEHLMKYIKHAT